MIFTIILIRTGVLCLLLVILEKQLIALHTTHRTRTGVLFLFKKGFSFCASLVFLSCRRYCCWCMSGTCTRWFSSRSRLLAGCTWSADRPTGLMQPSLRESRERTAFEREVNAPPGPRTEARRRLWICCLSIPRQCALLYPVPTRLYLASPRPSSSRLALTCLLA